MSIQEFSAQEKEYLRQAADLIDSTGIITGAYEGDNCYCTVGALGKVIYDMPDLADARFYADQIDGKQAQFSLDNLLDKIEENYTGGQRISNWNDDMVAIHGPEAAKVAIVAQLRIWASE